MTADWIRRNYGKYLKSPEWIRRKKDALRLAGNRCQVCYEPKKLEVHHRTYERVGAELSSDLTVLCDGCHGLFHGSIPSGRTPTSKSKMKARPCRTCRKGINGRQHVKGRCFQCEEKRLLKRRAKAG